MSTFRRFGVASLAILTAIGLALPGGAGAQEGPVPLISGPDSDLPDLDTSRSLFDLSAMGDEGSMGSRSGGPASWCTSNVAGFGQYFRLGCRSPQYNRDPDGGSTQSYFDFGLNFLAPASDLPDVIDPVESGLKGAGYTANITSIILGSAIRGGSDKLWASDRSGSQLINLGVRGTDDSSCTNFQGFNGGFMQTNFQMLPASDCPATIPATGWLGRHPIEAEGYLAMHEQDPEFYESDPFAFWRVPEELQRTDKRLGDFATYGELSDFYLQALGKYGAVIPGQSGAPEYEGWPLGLTVFFDAFYFGLPTISGVQYTQMTIVNESEKVYGVGVTYDSLYIGIGYDPLMDIQDSSQYFDPSRSAILHNNTGDGCADAPDSGRCSSDATGFEYGVAGIAVLKSPIGDMRFKQLSDPESDFFDPTHDRAGDTITFQHQHMCGFGGCAPNTMGWSQRAHFGLYSSTGVNVLDGRTSSDLGGDYPFVFRNGQDGNLTGEFNKYVPSVDDSQPMWDWNGDGVPDTIYSDACDSDGCVGLYSDTLPNGYTMSYGNVAAMSVGPVHIEPGDTVPFVVAQLGAPDSAQMDALLNNTIDFYNRFYLGPESAPAPVITAVDVVAGQGPTLAVEGNSITLYFDDTSEDWVDPFLQSLDVAGDLALNPWLADSVSALIDNNVAAIHIFKSCDGGTSYTNDDDCDGDGVGDPTSKWSAFGWEPYETLEASDDGEIPNTFEDTDVNPGVTYTYVLVTETRGAEFNLVRQAGADLTAEVVTFAPSLLGSLSAASTNPNVALVYAPLNLAAGARRAELEIGQRTGTSTVPVDVSVIGTAPVGDDYRTVFVDSLEVLQVDNLVDGSVESTQTSVTGWALATVTGAGGGAERAILDTYTFDRSGTVTTSGLVRTGQEATETQRTTTWSSEEGDLGMVVAKSGDSPLLASTTLSGDEATPGAFIGREDFPFFSIGVNAGDGGTFDDERYITADGDTLATRVSPSIQWLTGGGQSAHMSGADYGTFEIVWQDRAFGAGAPFNVTDLAQLETNFSASLAGRAQASTSSTSAEDLEAVKAVDAGVTMDAADLVAYSLPFTVRNAAFGGRDVSVLVTDHADSVLLGLGTDTVRIAAPESLWLPGDEMYFVETVTRPQLDEDTGHQIVQGGQLQTETVRLATFRAVLGCSAPRASCDPTIGGDQVTGYQTMRPGLTEEVKYFVPLHAGDEVPFTVRPAITADQAQAAGAVTLEGVHVVPNPYLYANEFERDQASRVLKFTNLPPEGMIRIFDVAGRFVQQLDYVADDLNGGDLDWDLQTRESLELGAGLYIYVLEANGERKMGKFVVIR